MVAAMPTLDVTFVCDCETRFGETLYLVGSEVDLGSWLPASGLAMKTSQEEYPTWTSPPVRFTKASVDTLVEYKYVKVGPSGFLWEPGRNRSVSLSDCSGLDTESTTILDGQFNIVETGRSCTDRVQRRSSSTSCSSSHDTYDLSTTDATEEDQWLTTCKLPLQEPVRSEEDFQKLQEELESMKSKCAETERLRSALESERADHAQSRARFLEARKKFEVQNSRAVEFEGELQKAKVAQAEVEKLKTELEQERCKRASSEWLVEERAAAQPAEMEKESQSVRDTSCQLSKAAVAKLPAAGATCQTQDPLLEVELGLLERDLAAGVPEQAELEQGVTPQQKEAKQRAHMAEQAGTKSECQHQELTAKLQHFKRRLWQLRLPQARQRRPLLGGTLLLLGAFGITAAPIQWLRLLCVASQPGANLQGSHAF